MNEKQHLRLSLLEAHFPTSRERRSIWASQGDMFEAVSDNGSVTIESPTGTGKTAVEKAILAAAESLGLGPLFFITPNKTLVEQIRGEFPDLKVALGRNEHPCLYYDDKLPEGKRPKADQIPCSLLQDCPHRVNQETGETHVAGAVPCPYLRQKYEAKQGGIVLSTMAFYLFTQLFSREWDKPAVLVIDEAHRIADIVRNVLSYEITDYHVKQSVKLLEEIDATREAHLLDIFYCKMIRIIRSKPASAKTILKQEELLDLMSGLEDISQSDILKKLQTAIREKTVDVVGKREMLRRLETLVKDLGRYMRSFEYSMPGENPPQRGRERKALNYTYAFYKEETGEEGRPQHKLVVKCYYVAPIIKKILGETTVAFSATIGDEDVFAFETGIKNPVVRLDSDFPSDNTKIFMPTDTPNLAVNERSNREPTKVLRRIAKAAKRLAAKGYRSLVVTISNAERDKFMMLAAEEGVKALSYGNGVTAKEAAIRFKEGVGDVLCGTAGNYAEGVDLPKGIAPVIFFLRPGYPNPTDPGSQFETERYGGMRWGLWNWRVMIQALQVRGRNIRSSRDLGVTFFISQQFRSFVRASLPKWLESAYVNDRTFDECVGETIKMLGK